MQSFGITADEELVDELDALKRQWDEVEAGSVSRSDVAREAIALGLVVLEHEAFAPAGGRMATQERKAIVRQALLDHFAPDGE